ncbi:uncharacterized protein LOC134729224 [Pan paniscus]|uniref:uncharacterized protein LOC134729224 n=1 Tax=Pan paniscus TaxID=9597 RepID=UPI003006E829
MIHGGAPHLGIHVRYDAQCVSHLAPSRGAVAPRSALTCGRVPVLRWSRQRELGPRCRKTPLRARPRLEEPKQVSVLDKQIPTGARRRTGPQGRRRWRVPENCSARRARLPRGSARPPRRLPRYGRRCPSSVSSAALGPRDPHGPDTPALRKRRTLVGATTDRRTETRGRRVLSVAPYPEQRPRPQAVMSPRPRILCASSGRAARGGAKRNPWNSSSSENWEQPQGTRCSSCW